MQQSFNIEMASQKGRKIAEFLDGLHHFQSATSGLAAYHAAQAVKSAMLRCGTERRCLAAKKALKQFNVTVSIANNERGLPTVRLYSAIKQTEMFL